MACKERPIFSGKLCLTTRNKIKWVELVQAGVNVSAGADATDMMNAFQDRNLQQADFSRPL